MEKIIYLLSIFALFSACNSGNKESGNNEHQTDYTIATESIVENNTDIDYTDCHLVYLIDGELIFHNVDENQKMKFTEEPDTIFNFTFNTYGETMYYSVLRDSDLWLKSVDIGQSDITPQWLTNWGLTKKDCTTETYSEVSPLFYYKGDLIIQHNFNWEFYGFESMAIYSIAKNSIAQKGYNYELIQKASGELSSDKSEQYFKEADQQLYYTRNNADVCLSDQLDFKALRGKESEDYWVETAFTSYTLSPDETKILYGVMIEMGDLGHGPYCIANADGSNQMILTQTDIASNKSAIWLKNNNIVFTDYEDNLFVADNDKNSIQQIAENVSLYVGR
ncbi:MAG: hypothetical protein PHY76_03040 [Patescibacteria group bacterium]|nr:hypothetical protein [Patescibacteria group bacterium]